MPTNDFIGFAASGSANILSQADFAVAAEQATGMGANSMASSQLCNKVWRQGANMAAVFGEFIKNHGNDALDNGDLATLYNALLSATASTTLAGWMSAADKSKLDAVSPIKYVSIGAYQSIIEYENQFLLIFSNGTATSGGVITFPRPFSAIPVVLCQHPGSTLAHAQAYAATTTGFTVAHSASSAIAISYIAAGKGA